MSEIKFAIVGCGRIAERHAEQISNIGKLVSVCDVKLNRAKSLAQKYNCSYFLNIEDLLNSKIVADVISICTPNWLHAEQSIKALLARKHVVCEKPMAISSFDCRRMIETSNKTDRKLFIVKQNRFNPPIIALKEVIEKGVLGEILNIQLNCFWNRNDEYYQKSDWKGIKKYDGGTLFTQFSHFIDLIYWLNGDIKTVWAIIKNFNHKNVIEFEDTGVIALEFENGSIGTINYTVNSYNKNMEGSITVFGTKGTVKVGGQYLNTLEYQSIENYKIENISESRPANDYGFYQGSMSNHDKVYENVVNVLKHNGRIATNGEEASKTVEIIERIYQSVKALKLTYEHNEYIYD